MHPVLRRVAFMALTVVTVQARQTASPAPAEIEGHVINALTGQPVRGVIVSAAQEPLAIPGTFVSPAFLTGFDGRFVFHNLRPGSVVLQLSKTGYVSTEASPITVPAGERVTGLEIKLVPEARISGRVIDQYGDPLDNVFVRARPVNQTWGSSLGNLGITDDLGAFVIGGLSAGRYTVGIEEVKSATRATTVAFYSGATSPDAATPVDVARGGERTGVDFVLSANTLTPPVAVRRASAQTAGAATVSGVVKDAAGRPVPRALAVLGRAVGTSGIHAMTDEQGRFEFTNVQPGRIFLTASRYGGFLALDPSLPAIEIAANQRLVDVNVTISDTSVVSGTLTDQFGDPISGHVLLQPVSPTSSGRPLVRTNARGQFRIAGVRPGTYTVLASQYPSPLVRDFRMFDESGHERRVSISPAYAPGVPAASLAWTITIAKDRDAPGVDIMMRATPVSTIDVTIETGGRDIVNEQLQQLRLDGDSRELTPVTLRDGARFVVDPVTSGRYLLVASGDEFQSDGSPTKKHWSRLEVTTDGIASIPVSLRLEPGARLSGRFVFEGASPPPSHAQGRLRAFLPARATVTWIAFTDGSDPGAFALRDVMPGRYVIEDGAGVDDVSNWMLKAVTTGGRDVLDLPVEIPAAADLGDLVFTFADRVTELAGTVTNLDGKLQPDTAVVVFPADDRYWHNGSRRVRMTRANRDGRYSFRGLPPGEYRIMTMLNSSDWTSRLPKLFPASTSVWLSEGDRKTLDLKLRD